MERRGEYHGELANKINTSFFQIKNNSGVMLSVPNGNLVCLSQFHGPKMLQSVLKVQIIFLRGVLHSSL